MKQNVAAQYWFSVVAEGDYVLLKLTLPELSAHELRNVVRKLRKSARQWHVEGYEAILTEGTALVIDTWATREQYDRDGDAATGITVLIEQIRPLMIGAIAQTNSAKLRKPQAPPKHHDKYADKAVSAAMQHAADTARKKKCERVCALNSFQQAS